jgi:hypothetical protein
MSASLWVQIGQAGTLVLGVLYIWVALLNQRRQLNAQLFIEFSGRFQELLRSFPAEAWLANRSRSQPLPPPTREVTNCTLYCIQFLSDIYHLHRGGYIPKNLWVLWEREIERTLAGPVFQREWQEVEAEFSHNRDFFHYVDTLIRRKWVG